MNKLFLLRHAQAAPAVDGNDRDRPLDDNGRQSAERVADWIAAHRLSVALALCSDALRTRQTLDLVLPGFAGPTERHHEEELYLADGTDLLRRLRRVPEEIGSALLVGHNPGLEALARGLADVTGGPLLRRLNGGMTTAALAIFDVPVAWTALDLRRARLMKLITPAQLAAS